MKSALLSALFVAAATLASAADAPSVAGKWNIHSSIQGYEGEMSCELTQTGADVSGTCKGAEGSIPMTGKVEDNTVVLKHKATYNGDELTITYTAKLASAAKFSGTVLVEPMGVDGEFTATPEK